MEQIIETNAKEILSQAFLDYSAYNLQRRAIPDARDGLKWSARQLLHAQSLAKLVYNKPFKKALKSVGQATSFSYTHGDSACYGTFIRMAKPFAYRYPLQEANGNYGTLIDPQDHSASRYVEIRSSYLASYLLKDLEKDTIKEWEDTYDMEGQFPRVLPSKGFYNICNGCISIGSGMSTSIPPTNLREVNEALIKLLWNPEIDDEEIIVMPDFPTGATILNQQEVFESLKDGHGKACKIRATVEYDKSEHCLVVTEMPYSTYTNTICGELAKLLEEDPACGIKDFLDLTGTKPDLRIYLTKNAVPERVLRLLYSKTSLQTHYSINMTMLDKGLYPKVFTWREALQAHLEHEKETYTRGFMFDLQKIKARLYILEGLLKAIDMIDEVIKTIKQAADTANANRELQQLLSIDETQAKAILEIKLSRLAHLEVSKLQNEQSTLFAERDRITEILSTEELLKKEIEKGLREVMDKFGDNRRTQILNLDFSKEGEEPIEKKTLIVHLTNLGNLYTFESTTLMTQRRGGRGLKVKMENNEQIIDTITDTNENNCLIFSNKGKVYTIKLNDLSIEEKINVRTLFDFSDGEYITNIIPFNKINPNSYMIFVTKNGLVKKSSLEEYRVKKSKGVIAVKLKDNDELVSVLLTDKAPLGILTKDGNYLIINTEQINATGRATSGVIGVKLSKEDFVVDAKLVPESTKEIISISKNGVIKRTSIDGFSIGTRATKGSAIQKLKENDKMVSFNILEEDTEIAVVSNKGIIRIPLSEIGLLNRGAQGVQAKKLADKEVITEILRIME